MRLGRIERARKDLQKVLRAKVRLKYCLMADDELRDVLPDALQLFDQKVKEGHLLTPGGLDLDKVLSEVTASCKRRLSLPGE